jgi:hypothetical protein
MMATRSIIARATGNGKWEGRYHHWDGYPAGVGAQLFQAYNGHFNRDVRAMLQLLIDDHPAGWSNINGTDFSKEPGFGSDGGPCCYCHGQRSEEGHLFTSDGLDFGGAEYCYVIDGSRMTILERSYANGQRAVQYFGVDASDVADGVNWRLIAEVDLDGVEPDWDRIE